MAPSRARLGTVGFVLGTHDFHQAVKPAKTLEQDSNPLGTPLMGTSA